MAVMSLRWLVAASAWLPAVSAGLGREQPHPAGPLQTAAPSLKDADLRLTPRVLTARPAPRGLLHKRDTNTCGYVDGNSMSGYVCSASDAQCLYNTESSAVGCCLTTSCLIYTACMPFTSSDVTKTMDRERTRYCSNSNLPFCAVFSYADPTNSLSGYTIPTCDSVSTTYTMYFSSFGGKSPSSSSRSSLSLVKPSSDSSGSSSTTDGGSNRFPAQTTGPSSSGSEDDSNDNSESSSPAPVGAIVGGVVGGVAGLGLIGLAIFFLLRRKSHNAAGTPVAAPAAASPPQGYMPPPGQGPYPHQTPPPDMAAMPGAFDPRYSMVKPGGASTINPMQGPPGPHMSHMSHMSVSPSNSPPPMFNPQMQQMGAPPQAMGLGMGMGTPPPPSHSPQSSFAPYPSPQMHMQQQPAHMAELPTQRGDGQVHELS